jgi:phage shock protein E
MKLLALGLAIALSAAGCASGPAKDRSKVQLETAPTSGSATADVSPGIVGALTARRLVAAGVKVVDVRTPAEFQAGHVPGAVNIPYDEIDQRAGEIGPPSTPTLLYCQSGRRSGIAFRALQDLGYTRLYDLRSYDLWVASEVPPAR